MAFNDSQQALYNSRQQRGGAERDVIVVREKLGKTRRAMQQLGRYTGAGGDSNADARLKELAKRETALSKDLATKQSQLDKLRSAELGRLQNFLAFTDPREHFAELNDHYPLLMLPLRIETRFKTIEQRGAATIRQLWVRVYPDEVAVDSFEQLLSENEVRNARSYLKNMWRAGHVEAGERAAWRSLVASHGSGRAYWIQQHYPPANPADWPTKTAAEDIILVIASDAPPPESERDAIRSFWEDYWRAGDDKARQQTARDELINALGATRAADIEENYAPFNLSDAPAEGVSRDDATLQVSLLFFLDEDAIETQYQTWTRAPTVNVLPERLVLLAFNTDQTTPVLEVLGAPIPANLAVGPDPSVDDGDQMRVENGDLVVNEDLKWMVDFDQAVAKGMGFKIDLTADQAANGFERLFVLGVRLANDADAGKQTLESLIEHHHASRKGFSILPQGTPTNNTEQKSSGYSWREDSDVSFDIYFNNADPSDPADWYDKKDGRWLAEFLGIDSQALHDIPFYHATDQREARALNTALWPATLGYFMESMMAPVFDDSVIEQTRQFFRHFISGRGMLPAIRVGRQPYGILPTTTFSRMAWLQPRIGLTHLTDHNAAFGTQFNYLAALYGILMRIDGEWEGLLDKVSHVGMDGDAHQILLDVVGLNANSVEFHNRYAQSVDQLYNSLNLKGLGGALAAILIALGYVQSGLDLLGRFGYAGNLSDKSTIPDVLQKFFFGRSDLMKGPLIDDVALSETDPIRAYTGTGDNYLQWLIDAAQTSHNGLRRQQGFLNDQPPAALLYLMLQHALDLGYLDSSIRLHLSAGLFTIAQAHAARQEPAFIYIQEQAEDKGSRWQYLYKTAPPITSQPDLQIADFIPTVIPTAPETQLLREQLQALERLKDVPTGRLERVFVEHLDTCSYRHDAWLLGLVQYQLALMRNIPLSEDSETGPQQGVYLGAYGWLEDIRPEDKQLSPVKLDPELTAIFRNEDGSLKIDNTNGGYIHAPSVNHAVTAAVLRNGYLANASETNPDTLAVNLSSERVRQALSMVEGMRGGQNLAALLGYQLERGLHDRHDVEVDAFIFDLRKAFPLVANHIATTRDTNSAIDQIEARNVIDGLALIEQIKSSGDNTYPFGRTDLTPAGNAQETAINEEVMRIMDINDAVADLAIAEAVHQVVQGNYDRAAATLDTYSKGHFPPIPDVIQTPRSGVTLTHRFGLQLTAGLDPADAANTTPRAKAEPAINKWLGDILPAMTNIVCLADYYDHNTDTTKQEVVSMADLGLLPVDLLYLADLENEQAMSSLDDAIVWHLIQKFTLRPDAEIDIHYTQAVAGKITLFELEPLLESLRTIVTRSRPLTAADVKPATEASKANEAQSDLNSARITLPQGILNSVNTQLDSFISTLKTPVEAKDIATLVAGIDTTINELVTLFHQIGRFGLTEAGIGFMLSWWKQQFSLLRDKPDALKTRWSGRLDQFDTFISEYNALPADTSDQDKLKLLIKAERQISTQTTANPPSPPDDFRDQLLNNKRPAFTNKLDQITTALNENTLTGLYAAADTVAADAADYDLEVFNIDAEKDQCLIFAEDLLTGAGNLYEELNKRLDTVAAQLQTADEATTAKARVDALLVAAHTLFGEQFRVVPEFQLDADQADEWKNAYDHRTQLLSYQTGTLAEAFPADEWLYGAARVRDKLHAWERATQLVEAFKDLQLAIEPVQFPYHEEDYWLALEYPDKTSTGDPFVIDEDKLLYTAHYSGGFDKNLAQCGLLLDEWTEVIPGTEETTGLSFHYDRPNAEPPQTLLLVTPSRFQGHWQWQDLVDTLHETLDRARKRGIEPSHIDSTAYARFLPALVSSVTAFPITAALNLALNNRYYTLRSTSNE